MTSLSTGPSVNANGAVYSFDSNGMTLNWTKANNAAIVQQIQATQKASKLDPKQASSSLAVLNSQVACFSSQFTQGGSCVATLKSN